MSAPALALLAMLAFPPQPGGAAPAPPEREARAEKTGPGDWLQKFPGPQEGFLIRLQSLCGGERYGGRVVSSDPEDADMRAEPLTMGPAACETARNGCDVTSPAANNPGTPVRWCGSTDR